MMEHKLVTINSGNFKKPKSDDLYSMREAIVSSRAAEDKAVATIFVQGYNRLDKTKQCVESILKHTTDVEYRLLLVDSGSSDKTLEYFKTVPHENTVILHFPQNISSSFTQGFFYPYIEGRYLVQVNNDIIVTPCWLSNLIKCAESDIKIGMVNPVSSNVSNLQQVDLSFNNLQEMEKAAADYNISDKTKWEERVRLITLGTLYKRECLEAVGCLFDTGFVHDFADDDISFQIRRAGYKLVLAKDTWVHHNHDFRNLEDKNELAFMTSLESGRRFFTDKYFGVDSWTDGINYEKELASLAKPKKGESLALGIDCRCGQPILDLKAALSSKGCTDPVMSAFEQNAKYYVDLKTCCDGLVACDREEFITNHFAENQFDYVMVSKPLNEYHEPYKLLQDIARLSKNGAQLMFKLTNTFSYKALNYMKSQNPSSLTAYPLAIPIEIVFSWLESIGYSNGTATPQYSFSSNEEYQDAIKSVDALCATLLCNQSRERILASEYHISVILKK